MSYASARLETSPLSKLFKALADDTRLRIVAMLVQDELCVCHLVEGLGLSQSNASRQLAILRAAGVVATRRRQKWVYYRLAQPDDRDCARLLRSLAARFGLEHNLRRDVEQLRDRLGPDARGR